MKLMDRLRILPDWQKLALFSVLLVGGFFIMTQSGFKLPFESVSTTGLDIQQINSPISAIEGQVITVTAKVVNNGATLTQVTPGYMECCVYPTTWAGVAYSASAYQSLDVLSCCRQNQFCQAKAIFGIPQGSVETFTFTPTVPLQSSVDQCNSLGSAWGSGQFKVVCGIYPQCGAGYSDKMEAPIAVQANGGVQPPAADIRVESIVSSPTTPVSPGSTVSVAAKYKNYLNSLGTIMGEVCIYPTTWKGPVYSAFSSIISPDGCCPANKFCQSYPITLNANEYKTLYFNVQAPTQNTIDTCNNHGSVWGDGSFEVVASGVRGCWYDGCTQGEDCGYTQGSPKTKAITISVTTQPTTTTTQPCTKFCNGNYIPCSSQCGGQTTTTTTQPYCGGQGQTCCTILVSGNSYAYCNSPLTCSSPRGTCGMGGGSTTTTQAGMCNFNRACDAGENVLTCPSDCVQVCNNNAVCDTGETSLTCPNDCKDDDWTVLLLVGVVIVVIVIIIKGKKGGQVLAR